MNRSSYGTWTILGIYIFLFLYFDLASPERSELLAAGAVTGIRLATGEYWRLLSAAFVHIGLLHLAFNSYFLYQIGPPLERYFGTERFLILYIVSGVGGNVAAMLIYEAPVLTAGGSTSLFGIMGALLAILVRRQRSYAELLTDQAAKQIGLMILVNLVIGYLFAFISNTGHIGGLLCGFGLVFFWFELPVLGGHARRAAIAPGLAALLLFSSLTALSCYPFTKTWFQAREMWYAEGERAERLKEALVKRGAQDELLDFLVVFREIKESGLKSGHDWQLMRWKDLREHTGAYARSRLLYYRLSSFDSFLEAWKEGAADPARRLPLDPWLDG